MPPFGTLDNTDTLHELNPKIVKDKLFLILFKEEKKNSFPTESKQIVNGPSLHPIELYVRMFFFSYVNFKSPFGLPPTQNISEQTCFCIQTIEVLGHRLELEKPLQIVEFNTLILQIKNQKKIRAAQTCLQVVQNRGN